MDPASPHPQGTVTFLFTDIEGSTRLLQHLGDRYAQVLADQRRLLRAAFDRWHGHELGTEGDSFFVAFSRAADALAAVVEGQRAVAAHSWPAGAPVRVRMGLHTGEPTLTPEGYVGLDVHRAARVNACGHGGQILLSQATRDLVAEELRMLMPAEVFISYARKDHDQVLPWVRQLQEASVSLWLDERDIDAAHLWTQEIIEAIRACWTPCRTSYEQEHSC